MDSLKISKNLIDGQAGKIFYILMITTLFKSIYNLFEYYILAGDEDNLINNIIFQTIDQIYISWICILNISTYCILRNRKL